MDIFSRMNIKSDALAINQYNYSYKEDKLKNGNNILRMISINDRGLSKSRNLAIENSNAGVCVIADDDLIYKDNYVEIISNAYNKYPEADIIAFNVPSTNPERPTSVLRNDNVNFITSMKLASFQLTVKRNSIVENQISFKTLFGAGARYTCGEENILLIECLKKGLTIKFVNEEIAIVDHMESTWYQGFNEKMFITKGAMFYEMSPSLSYLLITQFAVRKWKLYKKDVSFLDAFKFMIKGINDYKRIRI
jgi:glycosyltransferase involved in cell wall biosynthesis